MAETGPERKTFQQLGDAFFEVEAKEKLYEWEVAGVQLWTLVRSKLLQQLAIDGKIYDTFTRKSHRPPEGYLGYQGLDPTKQLLKYVIGLRWFLRGILPKPADPLARKWLSATELLVPFSTRTASGNDPLSEPVLAELADEVLVLGQGAWDQVSDRPHIKFLQNRARQRIGKLVALWTRIATAKSDREKWNRIIEFLEKAAGAKLTKYRGFPWWAINDYLCDSRLFKKIFKRIKVRHLFIVNATSMSLTGALQEIGIPTIELQQGFISRHSMQFAWPGRPIIKYLPAEIWTWGQIWTEGIQNAGNQTVRVVGATENFSEIRKLQLGSQPGWERVLGRVVIMSQPVFGEEMFESATVMARELPAQEIVFKAHPRENLAHYKSLLESESLPKNLRLATQDESSLALCSTSEFVVGVFSTTLIEALGLGAKVAILKKSGWEALSHLVSGGYALAFDDIEELSRSLAKLPENKNPLHFYAKQVDLAHELSELRKRKA
jgi:hypothetical protein